MTSADQVVVTPLAQPSTVAVQVDDLRPMVQVSAMAMAELAQTFETLAQNIKGQPFSVRRDAQGRLVSVVYAGGRIIKTLQRNSADGLVAVVLTGTDLGQRRLTKQLLRNDDGVLTGATYSAEGGV